MSVHAVMLVLGHSAVLPAALTGYLIDHFSRTVPFGLFSCGVGSQAPFLTLACWLDIEIQSCVDDGSAGSQDEALRPRSRRAPRESPKDVEVAALLEAEVVLVERKTRLDRS